MHIKLLVDNPTAGFSVGTQNPNYRIHIIKEYIDEKADEPEKAWFIVARNMDTHGRHDDDIRLSEGYTSERHVLNAWKNGFETNQAENPPEKKQEFRILLSHLKIAGLALQVS